MPPKGKTTAKPAALGGDDANSAPEPSAPDAAPVPDENPPAAPEAPELAPESPGAGDVQDADAEGGGLDTPLEDIEPDGTVLGSPLTLKQINAIRAEDGLEPLPVAEKPETEVIAEDLVNVAVPCPTCYPKGWFEGAEEGTRAACPHMAIIFGEFEPLPRALALELGYEDRSEKQ